MSANSRDTDELPDYVRANRSYWDGMAGDWVAAGERNWASSEPYWGTWQVPESELHLLPDVADKDVVELGCGTAYVSSWLTRRGARVVGIDNSQRQLETARRMQAQHNVHFPLIHGNAEGVPYEDSSFDFAISEYGAVIWCDPYRWIPEAARLLRPGGRLVFLGNSPLLMVCVPDYEEQDAANVMLRPWFNMHKFEWPDSPGVEFHLNHGDMFRLLKQTGFRVVDLIEIRAPVGEGSRFGVPNEWARRWPAEEVWIADLEAKL